MNIADQLTQSIANRYSIEREIGRGGMATVFLARDLRHDRHVAIKVLDPELGATLGSDRFLSEIRTTANLHHPNLLPLFDSGAGNGLLWYVMPFVEGESLRQRLDREKQLPVDDAVRIATGIAQALSYAHARGVIHRDLKPENVLLQSGQPLVADFGIALALSAAGGARMTQTGLSLGTPQYMSPEQATGDRQVDARTDIYSLGAVLYEMLTGEAPHTGNTVQAVIAKLLTESPRAVRTLRPGVPAYIEATVDAALAKLPADRIQSADRFVEALHERDPEINRALARRSAERAGSGHRSTMRRVMTTAPWFLMALAGIAYAYSRAQRTGVPASIIRSILAVDDPAGIRNIVLTPDGQHLIIARESPANARLEMRSLSELDVREIPGTEGARSPFVSPDSKWIGFNANNRLKRMPLAGGPIEDLGAMEWGGFSSAVWTNDGMIYVQTGRRLSRMPAAGGTLELVSADSLARCVFPFVTPSAKYVLCIEGGPQGWEDDFLRSYRLSDGTTFKSAIPGRHVLAMFGNYVIVRYGADGALMAVHFDEKTGRFDGEPILVSAANQLATIAQNGTLVYLHNDNLQRLVLRAGDSSRTVWSPAWPVRSPSYSRDGRYIAVTRTDPADEIWTYDLATGSTSRVSAHGAAPAWTSDNRRVLYRIPAPGMQASHDLAWRVIDGSAPEQPLFHHDSMRIDRAIMSNDGKALLVSSGGPRPGLWRVPLDSTDRPLEFAESSSRPSNPRMSPDGKLVAYVSQIDDEAAVVIRPYPGPGGVVVVSVGGGTEPVWHPSGKALFYRQGDTFVRATIQREPVLQVTARDVVLRGSFTRSTAGSYDAAPDGQRLLVMESAAGGGQLVLVTNWFSELRRRLGVER